MAFRNLNQLVLLTSQRRHRHYWNFYGGTGLFFKGQNQRGAMFRLHKHLNFAFRLFSSSFLSFLSDCSNSSIWILPQCRHTFVITFSQASKLTNLKHGLNMTHFRHDTLSSSHFPKHQSWLTSTWTECTLSELLFISLSSKDFLRLHFHHNTYCLYKCANQILCCESQLKYTPVRKCHHSTQCNICRSVNFHAKFAVTSKMLYYE